MKKYPHRIEIPVPIYKLVVVIFFGDTVARMVSIGKRRGMDASCFSKEWIEQTQDLIDDTCEGFCGHYGQDNSDILIWLRKKPETANEYDVLYHELYHAVDSIAGGIDPLDHMTSKSGHSEARARLFSFIATSANRILW